MKGGGTFKLPCGEGQRRVRFLETGWARPDLRERSGPGAFWKACLGPSWGDAKLGDLPGDPMRMPATLAVLLLVSPAWAQHHHPVPPLTHLGVPAADLITVELNTRADLSTGVVTNDVATYQNGVRTWNGGAKQFEVPKGRTFIVTDAQAWVLHESGTGTPGSIELVLDSPAGNYVGSMALFAFREVPANASGVQRQTWTSGFALLEGIRLKIWVQQFYPASLMSMARIVVHGYYL